MTLRERDSIIMNHVWLVKRLNVGTIMFDKVQFLKQGIVLIDIMDGTKYEITAGKSYELLPTTKANRQYHTIKGSFIGCINEYWLELDAKNHVRLSRALTGRTIDGIPLPITTRQQLTEFQINNLVVGHLIEGGFYCERCSLKMNLSHPAALAVYPNNILPYSQDCWKCGQMIFEVAKDRHGKSAVIFKKPIKEKK